MSTGRPRGRPRTGSTQLTVRLPPDLLALVDGIVARHPPPKPSRAEAVRLVLATLNKLAVLSPPKDPEAGAGA